MKIFRLSLLLTVLMSIVGTRATAHDIAAENSDGVTIYYNWWNANKELGVTYRGGSSTSYNEYTGIVNIPSSVSYNGVNYPVTRISMEAFSDCTGLTSVSIPNSITTIYSQAFYGCTSLESVNIPNSVTKIYSEAFSGCTNLTSVNIPNSVTTIENEAFFGCGLTSVTIPNSVTKITPPTFYLCI